MLKNAGPLFGVGFAALKMAQDSNILGPYKKFFVCMDNDSWCRHSSYKFTCFLSYLMGHQKNEKQKCKEKIFLLEKILLL